MNNTKKIRIGGGQGFWGDSPDAAIDMVKNGNLDYLACDYLAELTMSILQKQKNKNPEYGYAKDFVDLFSEIVEDCNRNNIKILANAGGVNVKSLVDKLTNIVKNKNIKGYKIGFVEGDNLKDDLEKYMLEGYEFLNMDNGEKLETIKDRILNANVYFGHEPIVEALENDADIVVTGRAADSTLFMSPLMHEFKWSEEDYDNIARGIAVGHLLECGGQASGGNYQYGWRDVQNMDSLGFPIAEVSDDHIYITKTKTSGGLITEQSLKEQFLYEIHDPSKYITPDVIADFSKAEIKEVEKDFVEVKNIKGNTRPELLKLSIGYNAGYKVETYLNFAWPNAYEKAKIASEIIMKKMERKNLKTDDIRIDFVGLNSLHLNVANMDPDLVENMNEVLLRIAIRTKTKEEAYKLIPEISPLQLNGPPGASFFGGRARVQNVIGLWPTLIPREMVKLKTNVIEVN
ncbi:acyclic terpene utilization AtuA family protein [uncultured Anaerococcus sp.]|uniref:acyclic terpene utilization AtuA family protein n=1 Tax=uncultured Anaerococcus sp. TaxID=293428 RepID=UPI0025CB88C3|nr:acyclic terpene utilization AtuA family protein [uncultured Anaerococcus sp.]